MNSPVPGIGLVVIVIATKDRIRDLDREGLAGDFCDLLSCL